MLDQYPYFFNKPCRGGEFLARSQLIFPKLCCRHTLVAAQSQCTLLGASSKGTWRLLLPLPEGSSYFLAATMSQDTVAAPKDAVRAFPSAFIQLCSEQGVCPEAVNNLALLILRLCLGNEPSSGKRDTQLLSWAGVWGPQSIESYRIRVTPHKASCMTLFILGMLPHPAQVSSFGCSPPPTLCCRCWISSASALWGFAEGAAKPFLAG